jgi:hypothetical protein
MTLSAKEFGVVNKVTRKTRTDCWFLIAEDGEGNDFVWDLEEGIDLSLREGIGMLMEAIDDRETFDHCDLSGDEVNTLFSLLGKLGIPKPCTFW